MSFSSKGQPHARPADPPAYPRPAPTRTEYRPVPT